MKTKLCPKCNQTLSINNFYSRGSKGGPYSYCKKCFNEMCIKRWIQRKIDAVKSMGNKCHDCNKSFIYQVYEFHHLYDKDYEWDRLRLRSQKTIDKELSKCVLLCANCHRIRHANENKI